MNPSLEHPKYKTKWANKKEPLDKLVCLLEEGDGKWPAVLLIGRANLPDKCPLCGGVIENTSADRDRTAFHIPGIERAWCSVGECSDEDEERDKFDSPTYVYPISVGGEFLMAAALKIIKEKENVVIQEKLI